jgi:WD40 repeat protein
VGGGRGRDARGALDQRGAIYDVAFAPNDSIVATASADGTVRLWAPRTGRQDVVLRHDGVVWDVDFSPDGSKLASASPLGIVRIWALDLDDLIAIASRMSPRTGFSNLTRTCSGTRSKHPREPAISKTAADSHAERRR